jgi:hypothetical protein
MQRRTPGSRRYALTGGSRKLYNEELHNVYSSPNIIRVNKLSRTRWEYNVAHIKEKRHVYKIFVINSEEKRPLGRSECGCKDDIVMDSREIKWVGVNWIHLAQDRGQW